MVCSKDMKKAIAFGLILGAILSICNLCFAADTVDGNEIHGYSINSSGLISYSENGVIIQFPLESNSTYTLKNLSNTSYKFFGFSNADNINVNDYLSNTQVLARGDSFSFNTSDFSYLYLYGFNYLDDIVLYREGMGGFVQNLAYDLSVGNLSSVWLLVVPIIAISVLFGLGWYLIRKILNKTKRAKGGGF